MSDRTGVVNTELFAAQETCSAVKPNHPGVLKRCGTCRDGRSDSLIVAGARKGPAGRGRLATDVWYGPLFADEHTSTVGEHERSPWSSSSA